MPNTYVVLIILLTAGRRIYWRLVDLLRLVEVGLRVKTCSTTGKVEDSESIGNDSRMSPHLSTSDICPAETGTEVKTVCFASFDISDVWTSLIWVKYVLPGVYAKGVAEANNGAGKIGPVATGEVVRAEGKKAVDGPELLDGNPIAEVGPDVIPGVKNSTDFFLR